MEYKFKEYERVMDTPNKMFEERAIVEKIMSIFNENKKYSSLDDLLSQNQTIEDFKKNNNMDTVLKHFGQKLNQEDYQKIIASLKKLTDQKLTFDKEGIKTTNIDDKEYISYEGKDENFYLNNSYSNSSIEEQMENLQEDSNDFQTADIKENTNRLMKELKNEKKISLILRYLNEINYEVLNEGQKELFKFAFNYQKNSTGLIRIDLDEKVLVDSDNNVMKIDKIDGKLTLNKTGESYSNNGLREVEKENKDIDDQLSFKKIPNTQLFRKDD